MRHVACRERCRGALWKRSGGATRARRVDLAVVAMASSGDAGIDSAQQCIPASCDTDSTASPIARSGAVLDIAPVATSVRATRSGP